MDQLTRMVAQGAGGGEKIYVEDVFSTYLYTGNSVGNRVIPNGIDLAGKGGLVWIKKRVNNSGLNSDHRVWWADNSTNSLQTNTTNPVGNIGALTYGASGLTIQGAASSTNYSGDTYTSWTFRKQPKFFDVVTYTGTGTTNNVAHSLQSIPGAIIIKATNSTSNWAVVCKNSSVSGEYYYFSSGTNGLNSTGAAGGSISFSSQITSTFFNASYIQDTGGSTNQNGVTYVAYLFAHDAGGFGASGTDNVISCGSFTSNGGNPVTINLGWEPQFLIVKASSAAGTWFMVDVMRGMVVGTSAGASDDNFLAANSSAAESTSNIANPTATGFVTTFPVTDTYIYIAIRRGPMRTPTTGASVFSPVTYTGVSTGIIGTVTAGFPIDMAFLRTRSSSETGTGNSSEAVVTRLTKIPTTTSSASSTSALFTSSTAAELTTLNGLLSFNNTGFSYDGNAGGLSSPSGQGFIAECFRRAPGFFDVVCYTGNGSSSLTVNHNLTVAPELMIIKRRNNGTDSWFILTGFGVSSYQLGTFDLGAVGSQTYNIYYLVSKPTSTAFLVMDSGFADHGINVNGSTYFSYLFASLPGVSKVGSYTGNGTSQTINCAFTTGARFVLIKRTDNTGDWYVWDTARGIISANDPHLSLNTTAAEVTTNDSIDPDNTGFIVNQNATTNINVNTATYIYLAIA